MKKIAIFPGSFDPFTRGHEDIVIRGLNLFDEVIIAVGINNEKRRYFPLDQMLGYIHQTFSASPNVKIISYSELTASLAKNLGAQYLLRGLRNTTDFEYENSIAQVNRHLYSDLETVFLITSPKFAYISSSVIRDVHRYGGNVDDFLPYKI